MKGCMGKCLVLIVALQFCIVSLVVAMGRAEMLSTRAVLETQDAADTLTSCTQLLDRKEVRMELERMGVSPEMVERRLSGLTGSELRELQRRMDELPAGAGALEVVGVVFLVLLILELVGVTNIFTKL